MQKSKSKPLNVSVPEDLLTKFKEQSRQANKTTAEMIREFIRASVEDRLTIQRAFSEYEQKLYNLL